MFCLAILITYPLKILITIKASVIINVTTKLHSAEVNTSEQIQWVQFKPSKRFANSVVKKR